MAAEHPRHVRYPFPLADGETAYVYLPREVSLSDMERLSEMLRSLVMNESAPDPTAVTGENENGDQHGQA